MEQAFKPYYDRDFAELRLDPAKIEEEGRYLLARALNIGRAIAFVGSGVSVAHGRPTWTELVELLARSVNTDLEKLRDSKIRGNEAWKEQDDQFIRLLKRLDEARFSSDGGDPDILTLIAQTHRSRWRAASVVLDHAAAAADHSVTLGEDEFLNKVKRVVYSDEPGIGMMVKPVAIAFDVDEKYAASLANDRMLELLKAEAIRQGILQAHAPQTTPIAVAERVSKRPRRLNSEEAFFLTVLGTRLLQSGRFSEVAPYVRGQALQAGSKWEPADIFTPDTNGMDWPDGLEQDPVRRLYRDLKIKRVLTTNYDFALERGLSERSFDVIALGYGHLDLPPMPDGRRSSRTIGGLKARSSVFRTETAADFLDFASGLSDIHADIFHLHGRAGQGDPIILTERDYQEHYLRMSPERHSMSEALRVTFGGNPILFVGLGMQEPDVLRPLRRFMSEPEVRINRSVFSLMPAERKEGRRHRLALQLYLRYGVHTIFYGASFGPLPTGPDLDIAEFKEEAGHLKNDGCLCHALQRLEFFREALKKSLVDSAVVSKLASLAQGKSGDDLAFAIFGAGYEKLARAGEWTGQSTVGRAASVLAEATLMAIRGGAPSGTSKMVQDNLTLFEARIKSVCLSLALADLEKQRRKWWSGWKKRPEPRNLAMEPEQWIADEQRWRKARWSEPKKGIPLRVVRYPVLGPVDENGTREPPLEPSKWGLAVRDVLLPADRSKLPNGIRVVIASAPRGHGKGRLFHDLQEHLLRLSVKATDPAPVWSVGFFANAAFSNDYNSVLDGLVQTLGALQDADPPGEAVNETRQQRLQRYLSTGWMKKFSRAGKYRILVALSGIDVLFHSDGTPKNRDVADVLGALLESGAPIDVVLIFSSGDSSPLGLSRPQKGKRQVVESIGRVRRQAGSARPQQGTAFNPETEAYRELKEKPEVILVPPPPGSRRARFLQDDAKFLIGLSDETQAEVCDIAGLGDNVRTMGGALYRQRTGLASRNDER